VALVATENSEDRSDDHAGSTHGPVPDAATPAQVLRLAADAVFSGLGGAMATVLARHGSAPSTPGQKLLLRRDGCAFGSVGGGAIEREVLAALRDPGLIAPALRTFKLAAALGMCCGGRVEIMLEPLALPQPVLVVGAGHVGRALAPLLASLDFAVTLSDTRKAIEAPPASSNVLLVREAFDQAGSAFSAQSAVLVMTHDHQLDQQVIEWALRRGFAFVGGVGSRAKALRTRERLLHRGFSEALVDRVRMPLGVDIGARLPAEIAVAIAAEMVGWRRLK
jgi:xanthine dehydrogenase accessory factor